MKKILTLTIATLSLVTLAACSGQKSDSDMKKMDDSSMMKKDDMKNILNFLKNIAPSYKIWGFVLKFEKNLKTFFIFSSLV